MLMQMRSRSRGGGHRSGPQSKPMTAKTEALALLLTIACVVGLVVFAFWLQRRVEADNTAWAARHGKCLNWTVTHYVPLRHYRCDAWERP
jgi:hypothetical protein